MTDRTPATTPRPSDIAQAYNAAVEKEPDIRSFTGLTGVDILVEDLPEEITQGGITREEIKEAIEAKLTEAGIPPFAEEDTSCSPYLYVNIITFPGEGETLAISVQVALNQLVVTLRDDDEDETMIPAQTWEHRCLLVTRHTAEVFAAVRDALACGVHHFIEAFRVVADYEQYAYANTDDCPACQEERHAEQGHPATTPDAS